jgi:hypothetical protein
MLRNDTGMVATDITVHIAPVPGDTGIEPRLRSLRIGDQEFSCGIHGAGQWRQSIPNFSVGELHLIELEVMGQPTCSHVRLSFVLSTSPGWAPEVDIAQGVVVTRNAPVVVSKLPFQGDAGVIFWVENANLRPGDEFGAMDVDFDFCDEPNALLTAHVVDEFSLLPLSGIQTEMNSEGARFVAPNLLGPLDRVAVLCTFQHPPNAGLVIKTRAY